MKEIFWGDYDIDKKDANKLANSYNYKENLFLFGKILYNSSNLLRDIEIFNKEKLKEILKKYEVKGDYKKRFAIKRLKILKSLILGSKEDIKELDWKI